MIRNTFWKYARWRFQHFYLFPKLIFLSHSPIILAISFVYILCVSRFPCCRLCLNEGKNHIKCSTHLTCRMVRLNGAILWFSHSNQGPVSEKKYGTIKIPPFSKALSVYHRLKFCSLYWRWINPTMSENMYSRIRR